MVDFLKQLSAPKRPKTFAALRAGNLNAYAEALHAEHYYEGFGTTVEDRIAGYAKAIASHLPAVSNVLGQEVAVNTAKPGAPALAGAVELAVLGHRLGAAPPRARRRPGTDHVVWYVSSRGA